MTQGKLNFIVVDDSKLDCFIAEKIIRNTGKSDDIKSFTVAAEGLEYVKATTPPEGTRTIILLDIQMPVMNGFDFVEAFEKLADDVKSHYTIFMLSSSINENDLNRVKGFPSIKQFLNKPLTGNSLSAVLEMP